MLAAAMVIAAIGNVLLAWAALRRQPPLGESMLPRDEFEAFERESNESLRRVHGRIDELKTEVHRANNDAERSRGNLHGKMETVEEQVKEIRGDVKHLLARRPH